MLKMLPRFLVFAFIMQSLPTTILASAQPPKDPYPAMAPLAQYLMPDESAEISLARTAAPKSISGAADIMVLHRDGYATVQRGTNGFVCMVQRSWAATTDAPDFWNPKVRSPICWNPTAAKTYAAIVVMKTKLVLAGKSKAEIARAVGSSLDKKEIPTMGPGAMCYMMSKQQYLNDQGKAWHPHLMFFVPGNAAKSWGGNLPGSPVIAADDPEERMTILMVWVGSWSDGTPAPPASHRSQS